MDPDALLLTITGDRRHRWSLTYHRASDEGLKSEHELRLESLCGCRRMRAAAPADRRISFRQVRLMQQQLGEHDNRTRNKNCRRSLRTRRERPRPGGAIAMVLFDRSSATCGIFRSTCITPGRPLSCMQTTRGLPDRSCEQVYRTLPHSTGLPSTAVYHHVIGRW